MHTTIIMGIMILIIYGTLITLIVLLIRALLRYLHSTPVRKEKSELCKTLGQVLQEHRTRCKMTQEFVAEALGVSRQAVSKWERGAADPSTANLLALAKLYGVSAQEILEQVR